MKSHQIPTLEDGAASLRGLEERDLRLTLRWRNNPASRRWFHDDREIAWEDHVGWFHRYLDRDGDYVFILEVGGSPVAQVSIYDIEDSSGEFGRLLVDPDARGQGAGSRATRLCLRVSDDLLALDELRLEVKADNAAAIRIYNTLGFQVDAGVQAPEGSVRMTRKRYGHAALTDR